MENVINESNFADVLSSNQVVLVDFWAQWCGPCRALSPVIEEIAAEYAGKAYVAKCNVDDCDEIAGQYRIMSIPCMLFFKDGKMIDRLVGAQPKAAITAKLDSLIKSK